MSKVGEAIHILQLALPGLAVGSEAHEAVLKSIQSLSKAAPPASQPPGLQMTQLQSLAQDASRQAPLMALMRAMSGGGGAPPGPGGPPAPPPPAAAAAA